MGRRDNIVRVNQKKVSFFGMRAQYYAEKLKDCFGLARVSTFPHIEVKSNLYSIISRISLNPRKTNSRQTTRCEFKDVLRILCFGDVFRFSTKYKILCRVIIKVNCSKYPHLSPENQKQIDTSSKLELR